MHSHRTISITLTSLLLAGFMSTAISAPTLKAGAPSLQSAVVSGENIALSWLQENKIPDGGYDIIVDSVDTNQQYRTTSTSTSIPNLNLTQTHCFSVQSRYPKTNKYYTSNQVCSEAADIQSTAGYIGHTLNQRNGRPQLQLHA